MAFCVECGSQLAATAKFCGECGTSVPTTATAAPASMARQPEPPQTPSPDANPFRKATRPVSSPPSPEIAKELPASPFQQPQASAPPPRPAPPPTMPPPETARPSLNDLYGAPGSPTSRTPPPIRQATSSRPSRASEAELAEFIGPKADYYLKAFQKNAPNWWAGFLTIYWVAYRKMYWHVLSVMGFFAALTFVGGVVGGIAATSFNVSAGGAFFAGLLVALAGLVGLSYAANPVYRRFCEARIEKLRANGLPLAPAGGVNKKAPWIILGVSFLFGAAPGFIQGFNEGYEESQRSRSGVSSPPAANNQNLAAASAADKAVAAARDAASEASSSSNRELFLIRFRLASANTEESIEYTTKELTSILKNGRYKNNKILFTCFINPDGNRSANNELCKQRVESLFNHLYNTHGIRNPMEYVSVDLTPENVQKGQSRYVMVKIDQQ